MKPPGMMLTLHRFAEVSFCPWLHAAGFSWGRCFPVHLKRRRNMSEDLLSKVRKVYEEAYNNGNLDVLDDILATNYLRHQPPMKNVQGIGAYKEFVSEVFGAYSNFKMVIEEIIADGNRTVVRLTLTGKNTGRIPTLKTPPTGRDIAMASCVVSAWENGKIVEEWAYNDYLGLTYQFGVMPIMPGGHFE
jgi:predicted ester cyclase